MDVGIVGILHELQLSAVVHKFFELSGLVGAELFNRYLFLFALDIVILFVLAASWQALPRECSAQEVKQDVADGLEVVPSRLLEAQVRVEGGVPSSASKVFSLTEWNVFSIAILVALCQAEVNNVDLIFCGLLAANEEVVRLDVAVNDTLLVYFLDSVTLQKLVSGEPTIYAAIWQTVFRSNFRRHS